MHRTSHWLGLDVHDVGDYRERVTAPAEGERPWRRLAAGMTLTVEPGVYLRPAANVPPRFHDIGVRIEDDVLVTATGHDVLSHAPKRIDDVEASCGAEVSERGIIIVGGGPVGLALALLLARREVSSTVIDARELEVARSDQRLLALARGTSTCCVRCWICRGGVRADPDGRRLVSR